jgi:hypothetical protein
MKKERKSRLKKNSGQTSRADSCFPSSGTEIDDLNRRYEGYMQVFVKFAIAVNTVNCFSLLDADPFLFLLQTVTSAMLSPNFTEVRQAQLFSFLCSAAKRS